jgi:rRNA maturation endonuclease Nob1
MKGEEVIVITDDYAIQNILEDLGIRYRPLSRKIKKRIKWIYVCSKCGKHFSTDYHEDVCAYCGGEIVRREKV